MIGRRGFIGRAAAAFAAIFSPATFGAVKEPTKKIRSLRATYTVEMAEDLKSLHGLDMESEIIAALTEEIKQSTDEKPRFVTTKEGPDRTVQGYWTEVKEEDE